MTGPIVALAYRYQRQLRETRREVRRLQGELAALHDTADTLQNRWLEERKARMDLDVFPRDVVVRREVQAQLPGEIDRRRHDDA